MTDTIKYQSTLESSRYDGDLETPLSDGKSTFGKFAFTEDIFDKDQNRALADIIKDKVDINKLTPELRNLINSATGVSESLVKEIEQFNSRIAALESDKLTSKVVIYASDVIEYIPNNSSSNIIIQLQNENGIISKDNNYTYKHLYYNINNKGEVDIRDDNVSIEYKYNAPEEVNIEARGTAEYRGIAITFPVVHKTIFSVLPSYIGYANTDNVSSVRGAIDGSNTLSNKTKLIKKSLNGTYTVGFDFTDLAYLYVAIPKNGNVNNINIVQQHTGFDIDIKMNTKEVVVNNQVYTVYTSKVAHKKGTYRFILK